MLKTEEAPATKGTSTTATTQETEGMSATAGTPTTAENPTA